MLLLLHIVLWVLLPWQRACKWEFRPQTASIQSDLLGALVDFALRRHPRDELAGKKKNSSFNVYAELFVVNRDPLQSRS